MSAGTSILGDARASASGDPFHAIDAASGETLPGEFFTASAGDVDRAVALASDAFRWLSATSGRHRAALLRRIAENLEAIAEALIARAHRESALPLPRLQSELGRTCGQLRLFATLIEEGSWVDARIDPADPQRKPLPKPDVRSMLRPLGPVAVFGASNFPLAFSVPGGDTASALAAGCPVIVKAHPAHPGTSEIAGLALQQAVRESAFPEGTFSLLFDARYDAGLQLVRHEGIRAVAFTGSRRGGEALMRAAADRSVPIPVYAEMGSINPVFILPNALRERRESIVAGLHASVTVGVGQFCTNPGAIVASACDETDALVEDLAARLHATAPAAMLTAGICEAYRGGVARLAGRNGVEQRAGTEVPSRAAASLFVTTATTFVADPDVREEVFGPSTVVVACNAHEELLSVARSLEGQLTVTVHGTQEDLESHRDLIALLEQKAGRIVFNGYPTGVEVGHAIVHGGPYPATSDGRSSSVGTRAIERFTRPVCWQDCPDELLPEELRESNPLAIRRIVDGALR